MAGKEWIELIEKEETKNKIKRLIKKIILKALKEDGELYTFWLYIDSKGDPHMKRTRMGDCFEENTEYYIIRNFDVTNTNFCSYLKNLEQCVEYDLRLTVDMLRQKIHDTEQGISFYCPRSFSPLPENLTTKGEKE
jgi:hypothetical protein